LSEPISLTVFLRRTGDPVVLLHDNGEGISPANRERIFTPFFTTRRNHGGTGLGLEIVASLLKAYGGNIRLGDAQPGAEFVVGLRVL